MDAAESPTRRGRSGARFKWPRQALSAAIHSLHPYFFGDFLVRQSSFNSALENVSALYRGDVKPSESCIAGIASHVPRVNDEGATQPAPPTRLITYSWHDRKRAPGLRAVEAREAAAREAALKRAKEDTSAKKHLRHALVGPALRQALAVAGPSTRRSGRIAHLASQDAIIASQEGVVASQADGDDEYDAAIATTGLWSNDLLESLGHVLEICEAEGLTPMIDKRGYVMAAIAGPPKAETPVGEMPHWTHVMRDTGKAMGRLYRNGQFTNLGHEEARVRFGLGYGEFGPTPKPHRLIQKRPNYPEIVFIIASEDFKAISAYQNHLYEQVAPKLYAEQAQLVEQLEVLRGLTPPFPNSVFTTSEVVFCDVPNLSRKNREATFHGFEALTVVGKWDWQKRGGIIFWDDEKVMLLRPGTTVLFPSGTKRYSFVPVAPHETRYVFRQYCHAGIMCWVEKGGRSDTAFDKKASAEEKVAWEAKRADRGRAAAKLYSKIDDIYVF